MKILLVFIFFHYIGLVNIENLSFILTLKEKNDKDLIFNIVHVPNFEINASNKHRT